MIGPMATIAVENYLKHVLLLSTREPELVPMGALAAALAVTPGTATTMVKALAEASLLRHLPHHGVSLTPSGRRLALNVLRKHRLVETFLVNILKMDWSTVHREAERLEHAISDEVLDRLDELLGHPQSDPHGDPIPSREGELRIQIYATLSSCVVGTSQRIVQITDQSENFLRFADQHGLPPGAVVRVTKRDHAAGVLTLRKPTGRSITLSLHAGAQISVELAVSQVAS